MFPGAVAVALFLWAAKSEYLARIIPATEAPALVNKERRVIPFKSDSVIIDYPTILQRPSWSEETILATTDQRAIHRPRVVLLRLLVLRAQGTERRH